MNPAQFLLCLIDASRSGEIQGRTLLQKRAYFVSLLTSSSVELGFDAHYYGPYSAIVDGTVVELKNLGFVEETGTGFGVVSGGFEMRRYDYRLSPDGKRVVESLRGSDSYQKIQQALERISAAGDPNYMELSMAAKAFYILRKENRPMTRDQLAHAAESFNWQIGQVSLERAILFLRNLGLTEEAKA